MKIKKLELQKALEIIRPGLAGKEVIEQSTSFIFTDEHVVTYNDEISIRHPIKGLNIEGAVHAEEFYRLLAKIPNEEFEMQIVKNELQIKAGRLRAGLTLQSEVKLPLSELGTLKNWKSLPEYFCECIKFVMNCTSRDMSRPVLTCIHINKDGVIEASDNYRIVRWNVDEQLPYTFLLPATSAVELVKLKPTHITTTQGWVHFKTTEDTIFSCRVFDEKFPDVTPFLKVEGIPIRLPRDIGNILDRANVFATRDHILDEEVTVTLVKNNLKIRSESDVGWLEEEAHVRYNDEPLKFTLAPYQLKNILAETLSCTLGENRLRFESSAGWIYITTLKQKVEQDIPF
jgi:DNA polymerase III sliding clamp (beta) subunit (PCNA family)